MPACTDLLLNDLDLSPVQKRVIEHQKGHLRITACPGSGKTEVVSRRVARLVERGIPPSTIVAFTFTNKAADDLKLRIRSILEMRCGTRSDIGDMYVGTIDSFCLYLIKHLKPEYRSFEVLDESKQLAFLDRWYLEIGLDSLDTAGKWNTITKFLHSTEIMMIENIDPDQLSNRDFARCYTQYRQKLETERFFDFGSITTSLLDILDGDEAARREVAKRIKHVVFDEYQDVNLLQERLLKHLSDGADSVCVVGDDDQNIFQWRGSNVAHMINFEENYGRYDATTEHLDTNYRATEGLVEVAQDFIRNNRRRIAKGMNAHVKHNAFEPGDISHRHFDDDVQEFGFVCDTIDAVCRSQFTDKHGRIRPIAYGDMAVIVRTNEDASRAAYFLRERGIPCITDSGTSVFHEPVVSLALDCIFYAFGHHGYDKDDVPDADSLADRYADTMGRDPGIFREDLERVRRRVLAITGNGGGWLPNLGLQEFYQRVLNAMGAEAGVFDDEDLYRLAALSRAISDYEYVYGSLRAGEVGGLKWFLLQLAKAASVDPGRGDTGSDAVRILTIWKAKGLEFPAVFIPSFEQVRRRNPSQSHVDHTLYDKARYDGDTEDERRSYYTAITRSQKYLFLSGSRKRTVGINSPPPKRGREAHPFVREMQNGRFAQPRPMAAPSNQPGSRPTVTGNIASSSYSELGVYGRCPYDYKLRHVLGFSPGAPSTLNYGTNIHNVLNLVHAEYVQSGRIPDGGELDGIMDRMFYMRFARGRQGDTLKTAAGRIVKEYVARHAGNFARIMGTEQRFEFTLGGTLMSGSIDLLMNTDKKGGDTPGVEIIDFKTDRGDDENHKPDHAEQLRFYAYAARESLGHTPERATIHHLHTQTMDYVDVGDESLEAAKSKALQKIGNIAAGRFEATPDQPKCRRCDFRAICHHKGFETGVDFDPVEPYGRAGGDSAGRDDRDEARAGAAAPKPSVVSAHMAKRAKGIVAEGGLEPNDDGSYTVRSSSDPDKSYTVTSTTCECMGFRNYATRHPGKAPTCSHMEAVRLAQGE